MSPPLLPYGAAMDLIGRDDPEHTCPSDMILRMFWPRQRKPSGRAPARPLARRSSTVSTTISTAIHLSPRETCPSSRPRCARSSPRVHRLPATSGAARRPGRISRPRAAYASHERCGERLQADSYWRGDAQNKRLSRIYGVGFSNKSALDSRLIMMAEAEKREPTGYVEVNSPGIRERALWET